MTPFEALTRLFDSSAASEFYGEQVTIAEHMLRAAANADADGAPVELVVAALCHDVGHLLPSDSPDARNRDHAEMAMEVLHQCFGPAVTEPIRLHVDAKRYLVTIDADYRRTLSPASRHTLILQGGPMTSAECESFAETEFFDSAVKLRRWDEAAKDPSAHVRPLTYYEPYVNAVELSEAP